MVGGLDAVLQAFATALRSLCEQWRTGDEQVYRGRVEVWSVDCTPNTGPHG